MMVYAHYRALHTLTRLRSACSKSSASAANGTTTLGRVTVKVRPCSSTQ